MKVLIVDQNGYLSYCDIEASLLPFQTWKEYYVEKTDVQGNKLFDLSDKWRIKIYERDYEKLYKPYSKIENGAVVQDTAKYEEEQKKWKERADKENRLKDLNTYFTWFNTQAIQHQAGTITDDEWNALLDEYKAKSAEAKGLKNSLRIQTGTQIRAAKAVALKATQERIN